MCQSNPGHRHPRPTQREDPGRRSLAAAIRNCRQTGLPWRDVLAATLANTRLKIASRRGCCGNHGQPGC